MKVIARMPEKQK
jgi:hypothetical protein